MDLDRLWDNAQQVVGRAARRADAQMFGTQRARATFAGMGQGQRDAMRETVVAEYGATAWDDFKQAVETGKELRVKS